MQLKIELKGTFNPSHHKAVESAIRSTGAVSSHIQVNQSADTIAISIESDKRHYLRGALSSIIANVKPRKTLLNGRETDAGRLLV